MSSKHSSWSLNSSLSGVSVRISSSFLFWARVFCEGLVFCVMEGTEPDRDEWIQSQRQCTDGYVLFVSVEVVIADGRHDMRFRVVCMVLDQVEVCYTLLPRIDRRCSRNGEMHGCNQYWCCEKV